jgi:AraC-like DNA-binding protein
MISELLNYITIICCYCIILTAILILRKQKNKKKAIPLLFFLFCVINYLTIDYFIGFRFFSVLLIGPFLLSFSFWVLSKHIFSDDPLPIVKLILIGSGILVVFYTAWYSFSIDRYTNISALVPRVISLLLILLAINEAQKGKSVDLIDKRKKLRTIFTYAISIIVLITIMVELVIKSDAILVPKLIQRIVILVFSTYFLVENTSWKDLIFFEKIKTSFPKDLELIDKIQEKITENHFYRSENLTVKKLADSLNEQEYKIRQAINQQLNYRNFNDFLNSYRINDSKTIFSDSLQSSVTILEVAYLVGFNSIGPFNRAFKQHTGLTPTEFRKKQLSKSK